jgi:hypothetical protein
VGYAFPILKMERNMRVPTAKQVCKFIRDLTAILVECRAFAGEVVFTIAAFYGLYNVFRVLIR